MIQPDIVANSSNWSIGPSSRAVFYNYVLETSPYIAKDIFYVCTHEGIWAYFPYYFEGHEGFCLISHAVVYIMQISFVSTPTIIPILHSFIWSKACIHYNLLVWSCSVQLKQKLIKNQLPPKLNNLEWHLRCATLPLDNLIA